MGQGDQYQASHQNGDGQQWEQYRSEKASMGPRGWGVPGIPPSQGLYDPIHEKDNCGVGFVAHVKGVPSHQILEQGLEILHQMKHRGAVGADVTTGDGAGILIQVPHGFLVQETQKEGFELPPPGQYAVGMIFLPREPHALHYCQGVFERVLREEGLVLLGWRTVPVDPYACGDSARATRPVVAQVFVQREQQTKEAFARKLLVVRKRVQQIIAAAGGPPAHHFYVCSLSAETLVYKGQILGYRLKDYYLDLQQPELETALILVHERYSTNTFPSWKMAHPYRYLAHNGEINTIRGNINWMNAREGVMRSRVFGSDFEKILPVIEPEGSDSASLDNIFEFFLANGHPMEQVMMVLVPEAWQAGSGISEELQAFYEYHGRLMQPWDGPATVAFSDGVKVGLMVDRNGLRPARYWVTDDDLIIMASETGVLDIPPEKVVQKGNMNPGSMLLVDLQKGQLLENHAIKEGIATAYPYREWVQRNRLTMDVLEDLPEPRPMNREVLAKKQKGFGYTAEELEHILLPMALHGEENIGAMGMDTPLAALSATPQWLFQYFRQKFAQVTNPAIDSIREKSGMSLVQYLGNHGLLVDAIETEEDRAYMRLEEPVITNREMEQLKHLYTKDLKAVTLPITFQMDGGPNRLEKALYDLCKRAEENILQGHNLLILSDRSIDYYHAPIPSLLAVSAVHHHLIRRKLRTQADLIVEAGDARDVMHLALLLGYGATALNPYLAFETLQKLHGEGKMGESVTLEASRRNYRDALVKGLLKIIAKMGISTLQSYQGAQIFEVVGLDEALVDQYFPGTPACLSGIGLETIGEEVLRFHKPAFSITDKQPEALAVGGELFHRKGGVPHLLSPDRVSMLQRAGRSDSYDAYRAFSDDIHRADGDVLTVRGLLDFTQRVPVPLDEVEPVEAILPRFTTGAVSFGSVSKEAHETMAIAMNRMGARSNSGEGGEHPSRYYADLHGNNLKSAAKQVASGRFGVTIQYLVNANELQIKVAQGAKPGEGGHLPGEKVTPEIGEVRHSLPGIDLISPPPHHDIYSIEDLAQLIVDLKNANPEARVSVKLVASTGIGAVAAGVAKAHADVIVISGHDGGTGASAFSSMKYAGLPWEIGLAEVQQTLMLNQLRGRVKLQADGKIITARDVVTAVLLGAEEVGMTTAAMIGLGCIMCRKCHLNRCPVGIATQDPALRKKFTGKPEHLQRYFTFVAREIREIMARLGYRKVDDMVGQVHRLRHRDGLTGKAAALKVDRLLFRPELPARISVKSGDKSAGVTITALDQQLLKVAAPSLESRQPVSGTFPITNTHRAVGTRLSGQIAQQYGGDGLAPDTIQFTFEGSAGQSFGAFAASGMTLTLKGDANDYLGKGLSGGKLVVMPPEKSRFNAADNVIAGNTLLYGATAGEAYFSGRVGHRFAVRNSGATAVVEGIGSHGCEYMTGGVVVVLGAVGQNFGAGMSGGKAFLMAEASYLTEQVNQDLVTILPVNEEADRQLLHRLVTRHHELTGSKQAAALLKQWPKALKQFHLVVSPLYLEISERLLTESNK
ncbi:glutamate synthase large subunit [Anoxynatronum buryatiense]|uniref:glutamate synthase large subunit n=1 Tax=Anoxynatronum buryatiense TaxID=489973 RepID=UPI0024B7841D|nr:glutamate synthase large subunit [Anoxynatronum buryatiense]